MLERSTFLTGISWSSAIVVTPLEEDEESVNDDPRFVAETLVFSIDTEAVTGANSCVVASSACLELALLWTPNK